MGIIDCALIAPVILAREGSFVVRVYGEGLGSKEGLRELVAGCRHGELHVYVLAGMLMWT